MKKSIILNGLLILSLLKLEAQADFKWKSIGPFATDYFGLGAISARVLSMDFSTDFDGKKNPAMYIAVEGGGLWRSINFQSNNPTWECITDNLPSKNAYNTSQYIKQVLVDPYNPSVVYIIGGNFIYNDLPPQILKSTNGGNSWQELLPIDPIDFKQNKWARNMFKLIVDPTANNGKTLYMLGGGTRIFYKSEDGGVTWNAKNNGIEINDWNSNFRGEMEYTIDQNNKLTLYISFKRKSEGTAQIYKSTDNGDSWVPVKVNLIDLAGQVSKPNEIHVANISFAADHSPGTPNGIFCAITVAGYKGSDGVYNIFKLDNNQEFTATANKNFAQGGYGGQPSTLFISPDGDLFSGLVGYLISVDGANSWGSLRGNTNVQLHADSHSWGWFNKKLYSGNDGGIYRYSPSLVKGGMGTWESLNTNSLTTILANSAAMNPIDENEVHVGAFDNALCSLNGGKWIVNDIGAPTGDYGQVMYDPDENNGSKTMYIEDLLTQGYFYRSDDGGSTFQGKPMSGFTSNDISGSLGAINPRNTSRIANGFGSKPGLVYESFDKGNSWKESSPCDATTAITYAADDAIWTASGTTQLVNNVPTFKLTIHHNIPNTDNWVTVTGNLTEYQEQIKQIEADPSDPNIIYLASYSDVFRTRNKGATWENIYHTPSTIGKIRLVKNCPKQTYLFVGTNLGISYSNNLDQDQPTFTESNNGIPYAEVKDIQYNKKQNKLIVAFWGRGVYISDLREGPDVNLGPNGTRFIGQQLHPNEVKIDADVNINHDNYEFTWEDGMNISHDPTYTINEFCPKTYKVTAINKQTGCQSTSSVVIQGFKQDNYSYGGDAEEKVYSSIKTFDGGYIMAGYTTSPSGNGDISFNHGQKDMWVIKTDAMGNKEWESSYGGSDDEEGHSIIQTPEDGGYIIAGYTNSQANGIPNGDVYLNHGGRDIYVVKIDAKGRIIWSTTYGGSSAEEANSIVELWDNKGNNIGYAIAGSSNSNDWWVTNNGGNSGTYDMVLMYIDKNGQQIGGWGALLGGSKNEAGNSLFQTTDGGIIIAGNTTSNDNNIKNHGDNSGTQDILVYKFDNTGKFQWQRTYGGSNNEGCNSIIQTRDLGYILAGYTQSKSNDGDIEEKRGGMSDIWVIKIKPDVNKGEIEWQKTYGGEWDEIANNIIETSDGGYAIAGSKSIITPSSSYINYEILKIKPDYSNSSGQKIQGELSWEKQLGGNGVDIATNIIEERGNKGAYTAIGYSTSTEGNVIKLNGHTGQMKRDGSYEYWMVQLITCPEDAPKESIQKTNEAITSLQNKNMSAYPNPAKEGRFTINLPLTSGKASMEIYNATGTRILEKQEIKNHQSIDLSHQAKGLYFIRVITNTKTMTQKLVVE